MHQARSLALRYVARVNIRRFVITGSGLQLTGTNCTPIRAAIGITSTAGNSTSRSFNTGNARIIRHAEQSLNCIGARANRYSTQDSSILGTIGKGGKGVSDEAARTAEALVAPEHLNEKEKKIWELLKSEFKGDVEVKDISGGCGSMYGIEVASERFRGLSMLKQQRLVNQVLGEEIKGWHGVQLKTRTS